MLTYGTEAEQTDLRLGWQMPKGIPGRPTGRE